MLKVSKGLCPEIMKGLLQFRHKIPYNLRQRSQFHIHPEQTVLSGTESIKLLVPKIWELMPGEFRSLGNQKSNKAVETHILHLQTMQIIFL